MYMYVCTVHVYVCACTCVCMCVCMKMGALIMDKYHCACRGTYTHIYNRHNTSTLTG